ncbi:tyrosine-type recombinase/integrase [Runella limosa]|uniref:tyrosine-type recombinase/integrase n=1 Tax=Runella limosa TaxID=370978 RepID=UPI000491726F|nr:site-specific integrase [Runella limosa]
MSDTKHPYVLAKIYPAKEKKGARYYIKYAAFDESLGRLREKIIWIPTEKTTDREKRAWAIPVITQINEELKKGYCFRNSPATPSPKNYNIKKTLYDLLEVKKSELRKKSGGTYQTALNKFFEFLQVRNLEGIDITNFDRLKAYDFRGFLKMERKNSNRTTNNNMIWVGSIFKMCEKRSIIETNPFTEIEPLPETDSEANTAFTPEHQTLLESWLQENDPVLFAFTRFLYYAFIRPKELRQIRGGDINLNAKTITVRGAIAKNKKTQIVPIHTNLIKVIGAEVVQLPNLYLFGRGLTWLSKNQLAENYAYNRHKKALEACGLEGLNYTLYSWKHTGACRAIEAGVNPRKLQGLLRHSSLAETDTYLRSLGINLQNEELKEVW